MKSEQAKLIFVFVLAAFLVGCSARQVYQAKSIEPTWPQAINLNTADSISLERLPGVGPKTAENIIKFRDENGPFRRVEHLMQIRGISEKRFLEIRPYIKIE